MTSVHKTVDTLVQAFQEYKNTNDQRLKAIETKGTADVLLEEKLVRLDDLLDQKAAQLDRLEVAANRPIVGDNTSARALDCAYKSAFSHYVRKGDTARLHGLEYKSLSTLEGQDGGYLIPQTLQSRLEQDLIQASVIRDLANVMNVSSSSVDLLISINKAEVGWAGETDERDATDAPHAHKVVIPVHEMFAKPRATQKLLDDAAVNVEEWLAHSIASKMAETETQAFLYGDGSKKPKGLLSYAVGEESSWGTFRKVDHGENLDADQLIDMFALIKSEYLQEAAWLMSRSTLAQVRKLKDADGRYLWQPGFEAGTPSTLLGHKVALCDALDDKAAKGVSVMFGNFKRAYQIVDRQGINILRDPYSAKPYVEFYTTKRVGGDVINFDALVLLKK
jgi:HK97 family phage major capsid protein